MDTNRQTDRQGQCLILCAINDDTLACWSSNDLYKWAGCWPECDTGHLVDTLATHFQLTMAQSKKAAE